MSARLLVCTLVFGVGVASACGGATDSGLFGGGGGSSADSGSNVDASGNHDGGGDHDASTPGMDAATHIDGDVPHDASPPVDTGPPPDLVACMGTAGCKVGTDACCRTSIGNNQFAYACKPLGQCDNGQGDTLEIPCDKQRDCELLSAPGDVCCVTAGSGTQGAADVSCQQPSACTAQQGRSRVCDPQMAGACVTGTCQPSMSTIPGYSICR